MDPQINSQPTNTPVSGDDPNAVSQPAADLTVNAVPEPTVPDPLYNEPTTVAMNTPAAPTAPMEPAAPAVGVPPEQPMAPAMSSDPATGMPAPMPVSGAMPDNQPVKEAKGGLPVPLLVGAAVILIGVILALVLL